MTHAIHGIDHAIIGVADLDAARDQYRRLGFAVTDRGRHVGWGTANYCVMFDHDYLELLGLIDPAAFTNGLDRFLADGEGGLGVVFATPDAEASHALLGSAGLVAPENALRELGRVIENGPDGQPVDLSFRNVHLAEGATPGLSAFLCQHLTPEKMRRPEWVAHPNTARGIISATIVIDDVTGAAEAYSRLFGTGAVTPTDTVIAVHTGRGVLMFATPYDLPNLHPDLDDEPRKRDHGLVALQIGIADRDAAAAVLDRNGVAYEREHNGDIIIGPQDACGVLIEFTAA